MIVERDCGPLHQICLVLADLEAYHRWLDRRHGEEESTCVLLTGRAQEAHPASVSVTVEGLGPLRIAGFEARHYIHILGRYD
jgi:hypothetical protein